MTTETINEFENVSKIFKGFLNIKVGTLFQRLDLLLELEITAELEIAPHYTSKAKKKNAVVGQASKAVIKFDNTQDFYGPLSTTDIATLTYMINKINNEFELVSMEFVGVENTDAVASPQFIQYPFTGDIFRCNLLRNTATGTYEGTIEVDITEGAPIEATTAPS